MIHKLTVTKYEQEMLQNENGFIDYLLLLIYYRSLCESTVSSITSDHQFVLLMRYIKCCY